MVLAQTSTVTSPTPTPTPTPVPAPTASAEMAAFSSIKKASVVGNSIQKTSGCAGCADSGAITQQRLLANGSYVEFTLTDATKQLVVGLNTGQTITKPNSNLYAFSVNGSGQVEVREKGAYRSEFSFSTSTVFRIAIESHRVKYYANGNLLYTSATIPVYPLIINISLLGQSAKVNNIMVLMGGG